MFCGLMITSTTGERCCILGTDDHVVWQCSPDIINAHRAALAVLGINAHIAPAALPWRLMITPPSLAVFVWDGLDTHIVPGWWSLTLFRLPQDLRIGQCRSISMFGSASCPALVCPLPRPRFFSGGGTETLPGRVSKSGLGRGRGQ